MEGFKCRKEWNAGNKEKVCLALHIPVNSQKRFVKRSNNTDETCRESGPPSEAITQLYSGTTKDTMSPLSLNQQTAVLVIKFYLHIIILAGFWYQYKQCKVVVHTGSSFGVHLLYLFYVWVEAMTFTHKGNKEIKLIWFGNEVTEGCLSRWYVQWTEKQISMSISKSRFLFSFPFQT